VIHAARQGCSHGTSAADGHVTVGPADRHTRQEGDECWEQRCLFTVSARSVDLPERLQDRFDSVGQPLLDFSRSPKFGCSRGRNNTANSISTIAVMT